MGDPVGSWFPSSWSESNDWNVPSEEGESTIALGAAAIGDDAAMSPVNSSTGVPSGSMVEA